MFVCTIFSTFFPNLKKLEDGDSKPPTRKVLSFYKISQKVLFLDNLSFGNSLGENFETSKRLISIAKIAEMRKAMNPMGEVSLQICA